MFEENLYERLVVVEEKTKALTNWQKSQNGSLRRMEDRLARLEYWIMGQLAALALMAFSLLWGLVLR